MIRSEYQEKKSSRAQISRTDMQRHWIVAIIAVQYRFAVRIHLIHFVEEHFVQQHNLDRSKLIASYVRNRLVNCAHNEGGN